ncbi:MAG: helix-turn-helix domain-containing protein [Dehalococcoidia bacterium]
MGELGSRLVRVREARGLTLEDAERDTRISRRYLEALEAEQFEVIPAPVYARGFLRSYSQYLGLDPQEMLALFPRDEAAASANGRPGAQPSIPATSASRPTWRREPARSEPFSRERPGGAPFAAPARPEPRAPAPGDIYDEPVIGLSTPPPRRGGTPGPAAGREPTIGIDIAVPVPTRRMDTNPAAQARSITVMVVAAGAVLAVILVAFIISRLGSESTPGGAGGAAATGTAGASGGFGTAPAATRPAGEPGTVPDVLGQQLAAARAEIEAAGYTVSESRKKDAAARGTVFNQAPAAGEPLPTGQTVFIFVSDGP